ncbi:glucose-1-phosphate cytidylyltransferase [Wukongibacter baidiensis]|uniref:glucose-1-phosphate cytidylyltransferase n=1 Tax=Wukongibacter baidiensis TaxID=1723361 RepID=UPI003D7FB65E
MKVVILAGGFGTRISEDTHLKPKPMIEIGNKPILWHIMKIYSHYGFNEFIICLGYKGNVIKDYFSKFYLYNSNVTFDFTSTDSMIVHENVVEPWKVTLVDTGLYTGTGGRIKRVKKYIGDNSFMLTYGDGVSNVNIRKLLRCHKENGKIATVTAVNPMGRFGTIKLSEDNIVEEFKEKTRQDNSWINGGFFVLEPKIFDYIKDDESMFEKAPMEILTQENELIAFKHRGFWHAMDTLKDKKYLQSLWDSERPPWKLWD